jgi:hypothetical protein
MVVGLLGQLLGFLKAGMSQVTPMLFWQACPKQSTHVQDAWGFG